MGIFTARPRGRPAPNACDGWSRSARYKKRAGEALGFPGYVGGGGGTAGPRLSPRAGLCLHPVARMRSVLSARLRRILVSAHRHGPSARPEQRTYESLQGRPEVGPLPTPRRCRAALGQGGVGFADVSPVFTLPLRAEATIDRTRVRKPSTVRTTCLAWLFGIRSAPANRQADASLAASTDPHGQAARPCREADVNDAAPVGGLLRFPGLTHQQVSAASRRC